MKDRILVFLVDLANTRYGMYPEAVPLGIGFLKTYARSRLGDKVDIRLFRTFEKMNAAMKKEVPDILGASWFGWNHYLTLNTFTYVKKHHPRVITVVGGANVPDAGEDCKKDMIEEPCIEMMIPSDGEIPFVNLLEAFWAGGREHVFSTGIDGVFYLSDKGEVVTGEPIPPRQKDQEFIPSPYLSGDLDEFLEHADFMPAMQTSRGCPFQCHFCVSGKQSWSRLGSFTHERVKAELDYIGDRAKNRTLRLTDENFGVKPTDVDIAKMIYEKRLETGYPDAMRLYTVKDFTKTTQAISEYLKDLIPFNTSMQTLTTHVLKEVGRTNLKMEKVRDLVNWAHQRNILATTEAIFGLPGETYASFMDVIDKMIDFRFDSIGPTPLMILKASQLAAPEKIEEYGYRVMYQIVEHGHTKVPEFESMEVVAWAVESKYFTYDEFMQFRLFMVVLTPFMFHGYFESLVYIWDNRNIKMTDVITELAAHTADFPIIGSRLEQVRACYEENLFESPEQLFQVIKERFADYDDKQASYMNPYILPVILKGEWVHSDNLDGMIDEVCQAAVRVFKRNGNQDLESFQEEQEFGKELVKLTIPPYWEDPEETVSLMSPYDVIAWRQSDYRGVLSDFRLPIPTELRFTIRSIGQYREFVARNKDLPFWKQTETFYEEFRSVNIKRVIEGPEEVGAEVPDIIPRFMDASHS